MKNHYKVMTAMQEAGRICSRLGHWGVPLSLGVAVGYYLSDRGVSFVPTTLGIVIATLIGSFALVPLGRLLQGAAFVDNQEKRVVRKRIVVLTVLFVLAAGGRIVLYFVAQPSPLTELSKGEYADAFYIDVQKFHALNASLKNVQGYFDTHKALFESNAGVLSAADEQELLTAWNTLYDTAFALDQLRVFHEDWYRFDPSRLQRDAHVGSFVLMYAAELSMYRTGLRASELISNNKSVEHFLNGPHRAMNLPKENYSVFKEQVTGNDTLSRVFAARQYLKWLGSTIDLKRLARSLGIDKTLVTIGLDEQALARNPAFRKAISGLRADVQPLKRQLRRNWLPAQKNVAMAMGDTKLRRIGSYLISKAQQQQAVKKLKPGDILLTRKNWYLSNVGLPGFWPHAILYLGKPEELKKYFDSADVKKMVKARSLGKASGLGEYLGQTYPQKWRQYVLGEANEPYRLIEAVGEGVIFNALSHAAGDYMAGLRPRLSKTRKALAIIHAFEHQGKPYDFDFDFATDSAVVCTELVWRSYRELPGENGLRFPLVDIMGRKTLPANEIAALYAKERGHADRQFDFVYFLDASETSNKAFVATEKAFSQSYKRTKWDMALP